MKGFAVKLWYVQYGREYHCVRCYTYGKYPWYQAIKYFPRRATDKEGLVVLNEFLQSIVKGKGDVHG